MSQVINILKYKLLSFLKIKKSPDIVTVSKGIGSSTIYGLFALGAYFFTKELLYYLVIKYKLGIFLVHEFLSIVLFIFFLSVNIGNIIVSYSTLFKSEEVNYLFTKPIAPSKIFIIKFLDNFFYSSSTLFFILISFMAGYASFFELPATKILLVFTFGFLPFMISAAAIGVMILLLFILVAKKIGIRKTITVLAVLYLAGIFTFFDISAPIHLVNEVMKYYPNVDLYFGNIIPPMIKFMPNQWLSSSLYWILKDNSQLSLQYSLLQIFLSLFLTITMTLLGIKFYRKTWLLLPSIMNFKKNKRTAKSSSKRHTSSSNISIANKDIRLFLREPSQVIHALVLLLMLLLFISSVKSVQLFSSQNSQLQTAVFLAIYMFNIFLVSTLSIRFVFPIFSLEGISFWKLKTSPLHPSAIIISKIKLPLLLITLISIILTYFSTRVFSYELIIFILSVSVLTTLTLVILNFAMGAVFANYKEKNPIRIASSQGASVTFLSMIFFMVFVMGIMYSPIQNYFEYLHGRISFTDVSFWQPFIFISLISFFILVISLNVINKSLKKDF